jgi:hypothetical protein
MRRMGTSRRARGIVRAGLVGGALLGCGCRTDDDAFLAARVPVSRLDSVLQASDSVRLPLADARTLLRLVAEPGGATPPRDTMTIGEILAWARAEHAQKDRAETEATAAERARNDKLRLELDSVLTATVVSKTYLPKNPDMERYQDYISLTFAYQNKGTKAIRAFQGDVTFLDALGDTMYSAHLKVDMPLRPGEARREPGRIIKYNPVRPEHQRLRDTPLNRLTVVWQPSDVIFADGRRITFAPAPEAP